jgi:hypothetical protein
MPLRKRLKDYNYVNIQQCSGYEPIRAAKMDSMEFGIEEIVDAGCDSCAHYHNGECDVYCSNNKERAIIDSRRSELDDGSDF